MQPWEAKKEMAAWGVVALPIMYVLLIVAGLVYYDPRPFDIGHFTPLIPHEPNNGFPSDHTLLCSATSSIVFFYSRKMSALLWLLTALVGASRIYTGVHHPLDIITSVVMAAVVSYVVWKLVLPTLRSSALYKKLP
jgi:undecaprenyl-diphosphatase